MTEATIRVITLIKLSNEKNGQNDELEMLLPVLQISHFVEDPSTTLLDDKIIILTSF